MTLPDFGKILVLTEYEYKSKAKNPKPQSLRREVRLWIPQHVDTYYKAGHFQRVIIDAWRFETDNFDKQIHLSWIMAGSEGAYLNVSNKTTGIVVGYTVKDKLDIRKIRKRLVKPREKIFC